MFVKSTDGEAVLGDPDILYGNRHIHTFHVEPGSEVEGKTVGELDLATRLGTPEFGIRSGGRTNSNLPLSRKLVSGEVIITFITDDTARALVPLFVKKV